VLLSIPILFHHCFFATSFDSVRTPGVITCFEFFARAHRLYVGDAIHRRDAIQMVDLMLQKFGKIPLRTGETVSSWRKDRY